MAKAAVGNWQNGEEVMALLLEKRVEGFEITQGPITELARSFSANSMALLLKKRGGEVKITEEVVMAAAGNTKSGKKVMALLKQRRGEVMAMRRSLELRQ